MKLHKFQTQDVLYNTIKAHPEQTFHIYDNVIYYRNKKGLNNVPSGHISLYEINVNRPDPPGAATPDLVYQFVTKEGSRSAFKTISNSSFDNSSQFNYGDVIKGLYPLSASLSRIVIPQGASIAMMTHDDVINESVAAAFTGVNANKKYINALSASLESYRYLSNHYSPVYSGDATSWNKSYDLLNLICVPSIFYGSSLKKGSVNLKWFITGTLAGHLADSNGDGELLEQTGDNKGTVGGVVMYSEGIMLLTGSWAIDTAHTAKYNGTANAAVNPKWVYFGAGIPMVGESIAYQTGEAAQTNSSYEVNFKGINYIPTLTMMAHAKKGELNYSTNPSFVDSANPRRDSCNFRTYREIGGKIKNIVKSKFTGFTEEFDNRTFISKIGIYDENKNLIAVASLANPIKKTEQTEYTIKMKMDF